MHEKEAFLFLNYVPFLKDLPHHVAMSLVLVLILSLTTFLAAMKLRRSFTRSSAVLVPASRLSYFNFFEILAESLYKITHLVVPADRVALYYPVVGSLFVFVLSANLAGLIPGFLPPTENMNTTFALGVFVFLYYNYAGFKAHGLGYLKHFLGPVLWLAPLMLVIELISHLFRPLSLALRLRGNIFGDHIVLGIFTDLVPYVVPVLFYGLGVFVAVLQAFVFCLMTMVYLSLSTSHDH
jgi:F-type H+-transporting ATPase subunit a